ncbi:ketoacyl-ACP synthase III [Rhodococcus sp. D2-41]|uniref:Beta-ketoacyl-[acyl-carrier-protein] synthase III n=1 Tax=Speluncibacter jeojiensis TaxID=2710754 RepID=A0A9X4M3M9_9ACTN|nr:beta-ketoacyl-ACP synthase III [Rhodococcus sp. D2-41]MDG3010064.1 ketoacyl-ACP synthase III [Rhodococcus sp. D2-41]MDG3016229.1 ketoacyl-ACP synthase III [Corynebacteriales bacterium D3-21]
MAAVRGSKSISTAPPVAHTAMLGLGVYRPERVVTNAEICEQIDSSDEWIRTRSGIVTRRFAANDESAVSMGVQAGRRALEASGIDAARIGCVLVATSTHLTQTPPASALVADALGTGGAAALDVGAGCAGFCYALGLAADLVRGGSEEYVLVVGTELMSVTTEPTDRTVRFIFGDGAGAVVVGPSETEGIGPVVWGSDGSQAEAIRQEPDWLDFAENPDQKRPWIKMEGTAVFRWAAFEMGKVALRTLERAGVAIEDLDAFIPHQANSRITEVIARSIHLPESVALSHDIEETGNTSAASIPLAMEQLLRTGAVQPGGLALLLAFGAGLAYAGQVVTMPPLATGA